KFGAKYAYTIDGDMPGELNKETFSADAAIIRTFGRDIHPGSAKDIMVNSIRAMADIIARMPKNMAPETTEGYEPYIHPHNIEGSVSKTELKILLRDFRTEGLEEQKKILQNIIDEVQQLHPKTKIEMEVKFQYRNMLDSLEKCPEVLDNLWEAAIRAGVQPYWKPIRGGTDGSRLTEMGLPTPNIFTGGQNFHAKTEWVSVDALQKSVETMLELCKIYVEKSI
ncbi:MAG TPA: tripeptide aminopeptidase PepT, partial [Candidatus Kapabacteria bacterium]|nr:tripeptide aminopeptidase PepT [Candidatus Kapabacteria bacterium]